MSDKLENFGELVFDAEVTEMAADAGAIVQLDPARVQQLLTATNDDAPEFPVVRVEGGTSRNGNHWSDEILHSVAEQVNSEEPVAYLGHIKPEDDGYAFPDPQTIWLKAKTVTEGGKTVLYVKGYNFPGAKIRTYLKTNVTKVASWRGKASGKVQGGVRYITQFKMDSFDWSRKGKQGMNAQLVALASEMEGSENEVAELGKVTLQELEEANPNLVTLIKQQGAAAAEQKVQEMEEKASQADEQIGIFTKLRELLGVDEKADVVEAVGELVTKVEDVGRKTLNEKLGELISGKVKNDRSKSAILRLMPVSEMEKLDDDALSAKVDEIFDNDDDVKAIVTEMEGAPPPLRQRSVDRGSEQGKVGGSGMVTETATKL